MKLHKRRETGKIILPTGEFFGVYRPGPTPFFKFVASLPFPYLCQLVENRGKNFYEKYFFAAIYLMFNTGLRPA
jgi:hypothetical protein